jgi:hypothetical protein
MRRSRVERRQAAVSDRARRRRQELAIVDEEHQVVADDAEQARVRALVSETPLADREAADAERHLVTIERRRAELVADLDRLEKAQDELLDKLR